MSILTRIQNFEKMPLSQMLVDMQDAWKIPSVTTVEPHNCESGMWITVTLSFEGEKYHLDGSRLSVVRDRICEWIDTHGLRNFSSEADKTTES